MKMSDVFELPINGACVHVNFHKLKDNYNDGVTPFDMADYAINNHDRLTSENARLREALRKSSNALERLLDVDESDKPNELVNARNQAHFTSMSNEELLTELEKGDEQY